MTISSDYSSPVWVNGFSCRNCSEVALAQKNVDPANPTAGPFGVNDTKKADRNDLSAAPAQHDRMKSIHHELQASQGSTISAAYSGVATVAPGQFVNVTA